MMNREIPYNETSTLANMGEIETVEILKKTISANRKLAELKGLVKSIPNQDVLIQWYYLARSSLIL